LVITIESLDKIEAASRRNTEFLAPLTFTVPCSLDGLILMTETSSASGSFIFIKISLLSRNKNLNTSAREVQTHPFYKVLQILRLSVITTFIVLDSCLRVTTQAHCSSCSAVGHFNSWEQELFSGRLNISRRSSSISV